MKTPFLPPLLILLLAQGLFAENDAGKKGLFQKAMNILDKAAQNQEQQQVVRKARESLQNDELREKAKSAARQYKEGITTSEQKENADKRLDALQEKVEATTAGSRPSSLGQEKPDDKATVITTGPGGASYFDSSKRIVVFTGEVVVNHPDFDIECEELEVYLKPENEETGGGAMSGGIDIAVAHGKRVVIRKPANSKTKSKAQLGQCQKATYYAGKGELVMQKWPQLQVGNHLFRALEKGTEMTLRQNGQHRIAGAQENILLGADNTGS